ncbi:pyruvate formate lyase family protein [Desulfobacula sp.]|uniref:glycyl radical protein n=1 Tax=Desulfobacula sp. TaxID=2593537 RepID=UPI0026383C20|nr:pyruvate formate lyase family protein [Desulfobacula sp.]
MNKRIQALSNRLNVDQFPICVEKAALVVESLRQTEGEPAILRRAKATAHFLDNRSIYIEADELIVGNIAGKPMGMEAGSMGPTWPEEDLAKLKKGGLFISEADEALLRSLDEYWKDKGRTLDERQGMFYNDDRLWPFIQSGILCPPWKKRNEGRGQGAAGVGWGLGLGYTLIIVDFARVLNQGLNSIIRDAETELKGLRFFSADDIKKSVFLRSVIISLSALVRIAGRYGDLAEKMALTEKDPARAKELQEIAEACRQVPGEPARTFREAMQSFWFVWLMILAGATPGGRFDQFMYPFYQQDIDAGRMDDASVLELLECLRVKVMQYNFMAGGKLQREKWSGMARWHNWVIGGVTPDGKDASNPLSYLILEAAKNFPCPHHTISLRVHDGTPEKLMLKALEVVKLGMGMPAFLGDMSYIGYLTGQGVPLEDARDYGISGCLDVNLPGKSRTSAIGMFIVPRVFEIFMNNGYDAITNTQLGPETGKPDSFATFEAFMTAFKQQLTHFMALAAEEHNILLQAHTELFPDAFHSALMDDAITVGRDVLDRTMPFENGSVLNMVGMVNVADSMASVKKLIFDEQKINLPELKAAMDADWKGDRFAAIRTMCLNAPKYGNGDPYVDEIVSDLYAFWAETAVTFKTAWGGTVKPTGISITAHAPGGAMTGATPDGRRAGETLADGTVSPAQGKDTQGPTAVLRSAMAIDQVPFQATLLNMKFDPSALRTEKDLQKLSMLIRTYFGNGGKHVQFNVVDRQLLLEGQTAPEKHKDLIVRVAGYSAYFISLTKPVQDEIICRTEYGSVN